MKKTVNGYENSWVYNGLLPDRRWGGVFHHGGFYVGLAAVDCGVRSKNV